MMKATLHTYWNKTGTRRTPAEKVWLFFSFFLSIFSIIGLKHYSGKKKSNRPNERKKVCVTKKKLAESYWKVIGRGTKKTSQNCYRRRKHVFGILPRKVHLTISIFSRSRSSVWVQPILLIISIRNAVNTRFRISGFNGNRLDFF
jgi:hypothetical protein